ncbi:SCO family protein [Pseudofrankia asymbiotica]|nr:SCO family protein [Pseudofrankia asymbiotica]
MVVTSPAPADDTRRARARRAGREATSASGREEPRGVHRRGPSAGTPVALLTLAALLAGATACADRTPGMRAAAVGDRRSDGLHGISPVTPTPKPALNLTGTDGLPFDLRARTAGLVTLLYFGYTHCPDVCPATTADLAQAMGELDPAVRARIRVVFVSVDPARDTPAVLVAWLHHFDPGFGFYGLTGPFAEVRAAARALDVDVEQPRTGADGVIEQNQNAEVLAFGRDGRLALRYPPGTQITDYIHDLPVLADQGATR